MNKRKQKIKDKRKRKGELTWSSVLHSGPPGEAYSQQYRADPAYRRLFDEAREQLRSALTKACGVALAQCAAGAPADQDPWNSRAAFAFHHYTLTYGLPAAGSATQPVQVPENAPVLAQSLAPALNATNAQKRLAKPYGVAELGLDPAPAHWQRLDLLDAIHQH